MYLQWRNQIMSETNNEFIPFAKPLISEEEEQAVLRIMRSGWLTTGSETLAFEKEFASFVNAPFAFAVNSATSGLHLALESAGVGHGDTVITSPYTFASTAAVVHHLGAKVVFCDTEQGSFNIDPEKLSELLKTTKHCKAVIPVHIGGLPCKMNEIVSAAHQYGCTVIEDAAHAFPVTYEGKYIGTIGDIGVYSFYATKTITTGEGGMVVTASEKFAKRIKTMRLHGIDRDVWNRYTSKGASWYYEVLDAGFKYNLPDILSAIGRVQLKKANEFKAMRIAIAQAYNTAFSSLKGCLLPPEHTAKDHAWHLYSLRILNDAKLSRDQLIENLTNAGIGTSVHFIPLHIMPFYAKNYHCKPDDFPNALKHFNSVVSLPIWHGMNNNQVNRVIETIHTLLR